LLAGIRRLGSCTSRTESTIEKIHHLPSGSDSLPSKTRESALTMRPHRWQRMVPGTQASYTRNRKVTTSIWLLSSLLRYIMQGSHQGNSTLRGTKHANPTLVICTANYPWPPGLRKDRFLQATYIALSFEHHHHPGPRLPSPRTI